MQLPAELPPQLDRYWPTGHAACVEHDLHAVALPSSWYSPAPHGTHEPSVPVGATVPAGHAEHSYSSFERVASTPQLPMRTEPAAQTRFAHTDVTHASLPPEKYSSSAFEHGEHSP